MRFILVLTFNKGIFFLEHRRQRAMKKTLYFIYFVYGCCGCFLFHFFLTYRGWLLEFVLRKSSVVFGVTCRAVLVFLRVYFHRFHVSFLCLFMFVAALSALALSILRSVLVTSSFSDRYDWCVRVYVHV